MRPILFQVRVPALPKRLREFPRGPTPVYSPPESAAWIVNGGTVSFTQGSATPFDIASTGPAGYTAGGTYSIDASGTSLPAGMSLTTAGQLSVGSAAAGVTNGVVFSYNEPGALPVFTLHSGLATGTLPWMGTVYPAEGAVPSGMSLSSPDDSSMRASVLSTWPDGSAQVMVVAGHKTGVLANSTTAVRVRPAVVSDTPLTTTDIASKFTTGIAFTNFGGGTQTLNAWGSPDRIWWANSQVICARYRQSLNVGVMEAVIDVHAFANGRAFVEVVIENSRMDTAAPVKPTNVTYTGATVALNGSTIATVSTSQWAPTLGGIAGVHQGFRAWYCSGWVGGTDPAIEVTHDTVSMQAHPAFWRVTAATNQDLQTLYQSDAYVPFGFGRHRSGNMGAGGDHDSIGPLPMWESRYLQSGSKYARRAVLASALSLHTFSVNFRDTSTNLPPSHAQMSGKSYSTGFPQNGYFGGESGVWEPAHQPASGLMAFLCRPSPCFIELSQKIAVQLIIAEISATQIFGYWFATRGRAWSMRNLTQAVFLTPTTTTDANVTAWKTAAKGAITTNVTYLRKWDESAEDKLNVFWDAVPTGVPASDWLYLDASQGGIGNNVPDGVIFQQSIFMHHFMCPELLKAYEVKVLTGAEQTNLGALVDWALLQPVRWILEQPGGGWRYIPYRVTCGTYDGHTNTSMGQSATWGATRAVRNPTQPATVNGEWNSNSDNDPTTFAAGWYVENGNSGNLYVNPFWTSFCAAVERGVSGAETAWTTVNASVTNLTTFKANGAIDPRHHSYPRNK